MPKMCGFARHPLKDGVLVTDPIYYPFIYKTRPDFRPEDEVCLICRNSMEHMYRKKKQHARLLRASRNGDVSTLSSNSMDSYDSLVYKTPQHQKTRKKDDDSSQSVNTDQSELSKFFGSTPSNSQSVNGIHERSESRSKKGGTTLLLESRKQISNESQEKAESRNNKTKTGILQENRRAKSISPTLSLATVIRKKVTFNKDVIIPEASSSRVIVELINKDNDTVASPTIYDDDPTDVQYFRDTLNVRLSQEPTTSVAATKAKVGLQQQNAAVTTVTPKSRGIRDYFTTLQVNGSSNNNSQASVVRSINKNTSFDSSCSDNTTAVTTILRTDQSSTSSRKRPLNDNADNSVDTNGDSDDDDPRMSLNYYNPHVRLPQYQPIPKRRQFQHKSDAVMDMYIQGLNGG